MVKRTQEQLPKTIDEAIDCVLAQMSDEDKEQLRDTPKNRLTDHHLGMGMYIRNRLRLWDRGGDISERIDELRLMIPDMASMRILKGVWEKLQQTERKGEGYVR